MVKSKRLFLLGLTLMLSAPPLASGAEAVPALRPWIRKIERQGDHGSQKRSMVIIRGMAEPAKLQFTALNIGEFNRLGFLKLVSPADVAWSSSLNNLDEHPLVRAGVAPDVLNLEALFKLSGVEAVVVAAEKATTWNMISHQGGHFGLYGSGAPPVDGSDPREVYRWLCERLGFDGIVLDRQGEYLLITATASQLVKDAQAVVLKDSHEEFFLKGERRKGRAILQRVAASGHYGLFRILIADAGDASVPIGSKVLLDRGP